MPDFNKDLSGKLLNKETDLPIIPTYATPVPNNYRPFGNSDLAGTNGDPLFGNGPIASPLPSTITANELFDNRRYDVYGRDIIDIEDQNAYAQPWYEQSYNGIVKGANLVGTTIAGGFGMLYGTLKGLGPDCKMSDIWDNEIMRNLDKWNREVDENYLPTTIQM